MGWLVSLNHSRGVGFMLVVWVVSAWVGGSDCGTFWGPGYRPLAAVVYLKGVGGSWEGDS